MKLGRRGYSVMFALCFLFLLSVMDYPFVSRIVNERSTKGAVISYEENIPRAQEEAETYREAARAYNRSLADSGVTVKDAFASGTREEMQDTYKAMLNMDGTGIMGIIEIPKIHVELPIYHGTKEASLQKGAGHLEGSSLPVGGEDTHTCLSAHRGLPNKRMFTRLDEMETGDLFLIRVLGDTLAYRVIEVRTVKPTEVEALGIRTGKDLATLITCTPYGINSHRLYVTGERTSYTEEVETEVQEQGGNWLREWWWLILNAALLLVMALLLYRFNQRWKRGETERNRNRDNKTETRSRKGTDRKRKASKNE